MNQIDFNVVYKKRLMDTFKYLVSYLNNNGYRWWAAYGTIIGAVRHNGLIPWDDDIDIFMPREDYERLIMNKRDFEDFSLGHYSVEHVRTDSDYGARFAKVMDMNTTIQATCFIPSIMGVFVDVFPLDSSSASKEAIMKIKNDVYKAWSNYFDYVKHYSLHDFFKNKSLKRRLTMIKSNSKNNHKNKQRALEKALTREKTASNVSFGKSEYCFSLYGAYREKDIYKTVWFDSFKETTFEDIVIRIPSGYHDFLTYIYGDYMTPPPMEKRVPRHLPYYINLKERLSLSEVKQRVKIGETAVF